MADKKNVGSVPTNLKESGAAQFQYGRESEKKLERTARNSHRLEMGNPDIGDVDLGVIEADKPAQKDDNSPLTEP